MRSGSDAAGTYRKNSSFGTSGGDRAVFASYKFCKTNIKPHRSMSQFLWAMLLTRVNEAFTLTDHEADYLLPN